MSTSCSGELKKYGVGGGGGGGGQTQYIYRFTNDVLIVKMGGAGREGMGLRGA